MIAELMTINEAIAESKPSKINKPNQASKDKFNSDFIQFNCRNWDWIEIEWINLAWFMKCWTASSGSVIELHSILEIN